MANKLLRARSKFLMMTIAVGLIAFGVVEGLFWWRHVTTTNAWVEADFTVMGSSINGRIHSIEANKGDPVRAGQLLAKMDTELVELNIASLLADLEQAKSQKKLIASELKAFQKDILDKVETQKTLITGQRRELETLQRRLDIAQSTMNRNEPLVKRKVVSEQASEKIKDRVLEITSKIDEVETKISEKNRKIAELEGMKVQEDVFYSRIQVIEGSIEKLKVRIEQAKRELSKMHIYAPFDAVINEVYVDAGNYVEDGDRVFLLHNPKNLWIEALVDDSEIRLLSAGQAVDIDIEAQPDFDFSGRVETVGRTTLGSMNGNHDNSRGAPKVPIQISLNSSKHLLWPGVRATAHIRVR
jgi:membrane fusion protein (multidrug efflux system)